MIILRLICAVPDSVWFIVGALVFVQGLRDLLPPRD